MTTMTGPMSSLECRRALSKAQYFLAFINDLPSAVQARTRLFTDDCVIYRSVKSPGDCASRQQDLAQQELWEQKWCMSFNPDKCKTVSITPRRNVIEHSSWSNLI